MSIRMGECLEPQIESSELADDVVQFSVSRFWKRVYITYTEEAYESIHRLLAS